MPRWVVDESARRNVRELYREQMVERLNRHPNFPGWTARYQPRLDQIDAGEPVLVSAMDLPRGCLPPGASRDGRWIIQPDGSLTEAPPRGR